MFILYYTPILLFAYMILACIVIAQLKVLVPLATKSKTYIPLIILIYTRPNRWRDILCFDYCLQRFDKLYCNGQPLSLFAILSIFKQLSDKRNQVGLCYASSTLAMIALNNPTSRIVRGYAANYTHSWLEIRYLGKWFCIDLAWLTPCAISKKLFYRENSPDIRFTCSHSEFSQIPSITELVNRLKSPKTSFLLSEICHIFNANNPRHNYDNFNFRNIHQLEQILRDTDGHTFNDIRGDSISTPVITEEIFTTLFTTPA